MSYETEVLMHFIISVIASVIVLDGVVYGINISTVFAAFVVGWSGSIAWMLKIRKLRPEGMYERRTG